MLPYLTIALGFILAAIVGVIFLTIGVGALIARLARLSDDKRDRARSSACMPPFSGDISNWIGEPRDDPMRDCPESDPRIEGLARKGLSDLSIAKPVHPGIVAAKGLRDHG
jgi:hypothetical protein